MLIEIASCLGQCELLIWWAGDLIFLVQNINAHCVGSAHELPSNDRRREMEFSTCSVACRCRSSSSLRSRCNSAARSFSARFSRFRSRLRAIRSFTFFSSAWMRLSATRVTLRRLQASTIMLVLSVGQCTSGCLPREIDCGE